MTALFSESIGIFNVSREVGDDGRTTATETPTMVKGAFRQRVTADGFNEGVVATDEIVVYIPPDSLVDVGDRVEVRGERYEVISTAFPQVNFRKGRVHHLEVRVRRSTR